MDPVCSKTKGGSCTRAKGPNEPELNPVSVAWIDWEHCYSPLDGRLVHRRITPSSMSPVPIHAPGWRVTMWGKVSCLRKQHNGKALNHWPSDLKSNALTTTPPRPRRLKKSEHICVMHKSLLLVQRCSGEVYETIKCRRRHTRELTSRSPFVRRLQENKCIYAIHKSPITNK